MKAFTNKATSKPSMSSSQESKRSIDTEAESMASEKTGSRPMSPQGSSPLRSPCQAPHTSRDTLDSASLLADLQRTRADFENYRKQVEIQREQAKAMAVNAAVLKLLPLLDDIDRAIVAYPEQLGALGKSLGKALGELKLAKMDTKVGVEFNPDYHDAISMDDAEGSREVIAETLRSGYLYEGKVLRPAMVRVTHTK